MADCTPRMVAQCATVLTPGDAVPAECPTWEVCLPFGGQLSSAGGCVNYTPGTPPPDGVYSKITIANGCIVDAELADIPIYTSPPCAPLPNPCDGGEGSMPDPSPTVGNMFQYDANGRPLVKLSVQAGSGITAVGSGTADDPLIITNTRQSSSAISIQSGNSGITVTGAGTSASPFKVGHALAALSGPQGLYTFDNYGHLAGYNPNTTSMYITGIVEGDGIDVSTNPSTGVATVSVETPTNLVTDTYRFGCYDVQFYRNRLVRIVRDFTFPEGEYQLGDYILGIDEYGAVETITANPAPSDVVHWAKQFTDSGNLERIMTFTTYRNSAFRVSYTGTVPAGSTLYVDSQPVGNILATSTTRLDAVPVAVYARGSHEVKISTSTETGFTTPGILDVTLSDIV